LKPPFDLVVCAFNTLQMLDSDADVRRAFEAARNLLSPTGKFVFDIYNASFVDSPIPPEARLNRVVRSFRHPDGQMLEVREDAFEDGDGGSVELEWRVLDTAVQPPIQRARLAVRLRHYSPDVIEKLLHAAGLRIVERYGDVRRDTFHHTQSKKQVVVCSG
jgi:hypothetical protein